MKNKWLSLFCLVLVSFVLMSGCGKSQKSEDTSVAETEINTVADAATKGEQITEANTSRHLILTSSVRVCILQLRI